MLYVSIDNPYSFQDYMRSVRRDYDRYTIDGYQWILDYLECDEVELEPAEICGSYTEMERDEFINEFREELDDHTGRDPEDEDYDPDDYTNNEIEDFIAASPRFCAGMVLPNGNVIYVE